MSRVCSPAELEAEFRVEDSGGAQVLELDVTSARGDTSSSTALPSFSSTTALQPTPLQHYTTTSRDATDAVKGVQGRKALKAEFLKGRTDLKLFFEHCIEPSLSRRDTERNDWIVSTAPFLVRAVGQQVAEAIALLFYRWNVGRFKATEAQHLGSFKKAWAACIASYPAELSSAEKQFYADCENEKERAAFRIFRDFALRGKPRGVFPTGISHMAQRIGIGSSSMAGIFSLWDGNALELVRKGQRRIKGAKGSPGIWRWCLELPPITSQEDHQNEHPNNDTA